MDKYISTNQITLHYLDHAGTPPTILLMPGLTANAHSFDGLVAAGLTPRFHLLALDLRGRGISDKPPTGYRLADHAADVIGMLDALHIEKVILGGHSFGGLLTLYMATHYPKRISHLILIDAASTLHPQVRQLIQPSLDRLGRIMPSWDIYREEMQRLPFWQGLWNDEIENFYQADVRTYPDGRVQPWSKPEAIAQAVEAALPEVQTLNLSTITQPAILLNALGGYGPAGTPPVLPYDNALATVRSLPNCHYQEIAGNHMTMLFADSASQIVQAITQFVLTNS